MRLSSLPPPLDIPPSCWATEQLPSVSVDEHLGAAFEQVRLPICRIPLGHGSYVTLDGESQAMIEEQPVEMRRRACARSHRRPQTFMRMSIFSGSDRHPPLSRLRCVMADYRRDRLSNLVGAREHRTMSQNARRDERVGG